MRWLPVHIKDLLELPTKQPEVYENFLKGHFTAKKTANPFSAISEDQSHEQNNARIKGSGGAIGITENEQALRRWMVSGPEISRLLEQYQQGTENLKKSESMKHHEESPSKQIKFKTNVKQLVKVFNDYGNPFIDVSGELYKIDTKEVVKKENISNMFSLEDTGKQQFDKYVIDRLHTKEVRIDATLSKNRIVIFSNKHNKSVKTDSNANIKLIKQDELLFRRMLIACQNREPDMDKFFQHENQPYPPSLAISGKMRKTNKSDLLLLLEKGNQINERKNVDKDEFVSVIDGAFVTQYLKPQGSKTINEYAVNIFYPHIKSNYKNCQRIDLVWDQYKEVSIKSQTREDRGKGSRVKIKGNTPIPKDWNKMLCVNENKSELFEYLSEVLVDKFSAENKHFVTNIGVNSVSSKNGQNMNLYNNCDHEEADTRIFIFVSRKAGQNLIYKQVTS